MAQVAEDVAQRGILRDAGRFQSSGDEVGTPPEDRSFRPDVEGLRAVAVLLVVLYHAGVPGLHGGYVGVDVFFVISGFVITGLLLRERRSTQKTSILSFYGRRCRRILPAASLVIVVTVLLSYVFLGSVSGDRTATDGRWAAIFLANFHFAWEGTNYLASHQPPSPLQHFWTLSVEEQFYLVYPTVFLLVAALRTRVSLRTRLAITLMGVLIGSFALSVLQTSSNPTVAYFSPFTRAWELALGALVALGTTWFLRIPAWLAGTTTWIGLAAIGGAAVAFSSHTTYPGSLVALPVVGAALVIAGGVVSPRRGAESLLGLSPCRWLGARSYSLYLWHWPILIIAAESRGEASLPLPQSLGWLGVALVISVISYQVVENPVRHARFIMQNRWAPIVLGVALIVATLSVATSLLHEHRPPALAHPGRSGAVAASDVQVATLVEASIQIQRVPSDLTPPLQLAGQDFGAPPGPCTPSYTAVSVPKCVFGDPHGKRTMVLYGDSHAEMWFQAVNNIAAAAHWKLVVLAKGYCMASKYPSGSGWFAGCRRWQRFAVNRIHQIGPDLIVLTQDVQGGYSPKQWQRYLSRGLAQVENPHTKFIVLGNIPFAAQSPPDCLAEHSDDVQACSESPASWLLPYNEAERRAVTAMGGRYIDVTPWFCSRRCSPIIGGVEVYLDGHHITAAYSIFLQQVLAEKLRLPNF
jgi:peptidoglycan/LPS O-acetylase OafA/YrhL